MSSKGFQLKVGHRVQNWFVESLQYKKNGIWWNDCKCICGIQRPVRTWWLRNGKSLSCGCILNKGAFTFQNKNVGDLSETYFKRVKASCIRRNFKFGEDITMEYLWELFLQQQKQCALSGVPIKLVQSIAWTRANNRRQPIEQTASLDRINNNLGYIRGNVQWLHKDVNLMKRCLTNEEFISFCQKVVDYGSAGK